jgi:hypothetical protein
MLYLFLLFIAAISCFAQNPLGVNITDEGAFTDIVKHSARYVNVNTFDSSGWPAADFEMVLMDKRPVAEWSGTIDDPEQYRIDISGTYLGQFTGKADISLWGSGATISGVQYDSILNKTVFRITVPAANGANYGILYLTFRNTRHTLQSVNNTGISGLRIMRPGYDPATAPTFTREYINLLKSADFTAYRFYTVQNIWTCEPAWPAITSWNKRKNKSDAAQTDMGNINGKKDGWCWEYIIELSNILKKDIWINIPISCDSNYVHNLAQMLLKELDPAINIYVENSNECWAPAQETHGPYNKAQADFYGISFDQNYARRTVELSRWFSNIFGAEQIHKRFRIVLGAQHAWGGRSDTHLEYIKNTFGPPSQYIYALCPAIYFNSTNPNGDTTQILNGMAQDIDQQIQNPSNAFYRKSHINRAKLWQLPGGCLAYEGGPHLPAGGGPANLSQQILVHRMPGMADILIRNFIDGWFSIGGGLAMFFTIQSGYNRYGCWGITDDYTKPDRNYKMQAVRAIINPSTQNISESYSTNIVEYQRYDDNRIIIKGLQKGFLALYTLTGQLLQKYTVESGTQIINLPNQPCILYNPGEINRSVILMPF